MSDAPTSTLVILLLGLLVLIAFFAGTEVALLTINRYRLRHRAAGGDRAAVLAEKLVKQPDRWLGVNLLWITLTTMFAPTVGTVLALRYGGDVLLTITTIGLGLLHSSSASSRRRSTPLCARSVWRCLRHYIYRPLLYVSWPFVWVANQLANGFLRILGLSPSKVAAHSLSTEELRTVVAEAGALVPQRHQQMLLSILDLEKVTVDDIMVPRTEVVGLDVER